MGSGLSPWFSQTKVWMSDPIHIHEGNSCASSFHRVICLVCVTSGSFIGDGPLLGFVVGF